MLYILLTTAFGSSWAFEHRAFIEHGENYYSIFTALIDPVPRCRTYIVTSGITGGISTLLVDTTIVRRLI